MGPRLVGIKYFIEAPETEFWQIVLPCSLHDRGQMLPFASSFTVNTDGPRGREAFNTSAGSINRSYNSLMSRLRSVFHLLYGITL